MVPPSSISFSALGRLGKGSFRVVWFGDIVRGTAADNIIVVFAPSRVNPSTGEEMWNLSKRMAVSLPVAYLRKFRMGDIWKDGRWTGRRDLQARETFSLDISETSGVVMPVGVPLNSDPLRQQYLLPFTDFEGHRDHTHAQCLRIALKDGSILVIPCMELIRFYFGASGSFLKRLFSGAFALDRFYSDARLNRTNRNANIVLAPDLSGVAATTVARIAFCSQARSAARWIVNSGVATSVNRGNYYPKTTFPFLGKTDLTAYGRWIGQGDSRIFLTEQLARCTHPFPFDTLFYSTTRSLVKPASLSRESVFSVATMDGSYSNQPEPAIHLTDALVSSALQDMGLPADEEGDSCFPDLVNKKIRRVDKPNQPTRALNSDAPIEELGAGTETSSSTVRGAELATDLDETVIDGLPPPDAAAVIERAVSANRAARADSMAWKPISGQAKHIGKREETFVRGDEIVKDDRDRRLQNIWAGVIEVRFDSIVIPVLVLIRDNITEDTDDHIVLLHLKPSSQNDEILKYCHLFAAHAQPEVFAPNLLGMVESERASNLSTVLRKLSMITPLHPETALHT